MLVLLSLESCVAATSCLSLPIGPILSLLSNLPQLEDSVEHLFYFSLESYSFSCYRKMTMSDLFLTMPNMRIGRKDHTECTFCMTTGHTWKTCFNLFGFPNKTTDASKFKRGEPIFSDEDYQEYLRLKASRQAQPPLTSNISTACISQSMDIQGPWVIDSGASDHISGDASLFTTMSSQKFPYLISL